MLLLQADVTVTSQLVDADGVDTSATPVIISVLDRDMATPFTFTGVLGTGLPVIAPLYQADGQLRFVGWSDDGGAGHAVLVSPGASVTVTYSGVVQDAIV